MIKIFMKDIRLHKPHPLDWVCMCADSCIRGHHIYKDIWTPLLGEKLPCTRETSNRKDPYAVCVLKSGSIVGHLPRKFSTAWLMFLKKPILCPWRNFRPILRPWHILCPSKMFGVFFIKYMCTVCPSMVLGLFVDVESIMYSSPKSADNSRYSVSKQYNHSRCLIG